MPRNPADAEVPAANQDRGAPPASSTLPALPELAGLLPERWADTLPLAEEQRADRAGPTVDATPLVAPPPAARPQAAGDAKPAPDPPADVLLVDDSEIALRYLQRRLADLGLRCDLARSSGEAQERLSQVKYRLVVLDVELGEASPLDGLALCREIKRRGAPAPIVALVSAHAGATERVRGSLAGCDAYLRKPLVADELAALAARLQRLHRPSAPPARW